jgi:hypothetical protein
MAQNQSDLRVLGSTILTLAPLGASIFPTKFSSPSGSVSGSLKFLNGSTVEILPNILPGQTVSGATKGGLGYFLGAAEIYQFAGPANFYIAATGSATAQISAIVGFGDFGVTLA